MTGLDTFLAGLRAIAGDRHVLTDPADMAAYRSDGRGATGGAPVAVVRPSSAEQVSAIVRLASTSSVRIVPQGAATGLVGAGVASGAHAEIVLSLDALNRRIDIDPMNRTATVDAGVRLSALNAAAAEHGLFFPIDLGADPMIGGMIAANTGGARLLRYGDVRANLKALDLVRSAPDGACLSLGAPLWKNNVGLDLKQVLVGSSGSLGIITAATVALHPIPTVQITALLALDDPHAAVPILLAIERGFGPLLTAFEGMGRNAMDAALRHVPSLRQPFAAGTPDYAILIELSGGGAVSAEAMQDHLADMLTPFMSGDAPPLQDVVIDGRNTGWAIRHAIPEALRQSGPVVACDIALRRGDVMRFREDVSARVARVAPAMRLHDFGHIGDGGVHFNLLWGGASGDAPAGLAEQVRTIIFEAVVNDYGGTFSAEHGVGPRNQMHYQRFVPEAQRVLAGRIQRLIAPIAIGRTDFGIVQGL